MSARDSFASRAPLRPSPFAPGGKETATTDPAFLAELAALVARGRKEDQQFGARIGILWSACEEAGIAVPGVETWLYVHAALPGADVLCDYLVTAMPDTPPLAQAVRVAIFRYKELLDTLDRAQHALDRGAAAPILAEQLRQKLFFLGHYYEDFQGDPVLKALFPAPKVVATAGVPSLRGTPLPKPPDDQKEAREAAIARARAQLQAVAFGMARVRKVLGMIAGGPTLKVADLFTPEARATRLLALSLPSSPVTLAKVQDAEALQARLEGAIAALEKGGAPDLVRELGERLAALPLAFRQDPLLRDLFPTSQAA